MPHALAMVLLKDGSKLPVGQILDFLKSRWPDLPSASEIEDKEGALAFRLGASDVILGIMPAPIPWSDLEGPCSTSMLWPDASGTLRDHQRHVVVTVVHDSGPIDKAKLLTQVVAAMTIWPSVVGVFWTNASMVLRPEVFREYAVAALPRIPISIWVNCRSRPNLEGGIAGTTTGLAALGLMELETLHTTKDLIGLSVPMLSLAEAQLEGRVFHDGEILPLLTGWPACVKIAESSFGLPGKVVRLVFAEYLTSPLQDKHPRLYGRLIEVDAVMQDRSGGMWFTFFLVMLLTAFAALSLEWYKAIPGLAGLELGSFWVYAIVFVVMLVAWGTTMDILMKRCYQRYRKGIVRLAREDAIKRYELLSMIEKDDSLKTVRNALKRDRWDDDDQ